MKRLTLALLLFAVPVFPQAVPAAKAPATTVLFDVGLGGGFGVFPIVEIGVGVEHTLTKHLELQAEFEYSPPIPNALGPAKPGFVVNGNVLYWATPKIAAYGAFVASKEFLEGISKQAYYIRGGVVIKDRWNPEMPGRLYITYEQQEGGCVWATPSNPCPITSSQLKGVQVMQEFRMTSHLRLSVIMGIYVVGQQVNPFAPQAGQSHTAASEGLFRLRYMFGKQGPEAY